MGNASPVIGVLAAIDPFDDDAGRLAAVLRHELGRRLDDAVLVLATRVRTERPDTTDWRPATPGWHRGCVAVLDLVATADEPGSDTAIEATTPTVRPTDADPLDLVGLAELYDEQIDDVARAVRRRVQEHRRWLFPVDATEVAASPLDRQLRLEADRAAGCTPEVRRNLHALLDGLAERLRPHLGHANTVSTFDGRRAEIDELRRTIAAQRRELQQTRAELRRTNSVAELVRHHHGSSRT
ncbi:MAG: hypothetical protein AAFP84_02160 [Actinomycetota bacterium]